MQTNLTQPPIGWPQKQGLYDPQFERDACGVGFVVNIKGQKSHQIIQQGLQVLNNLTHRGATGAEPNTGDGAGILFQLPHKFFKKVCDFDLPEPGQYGVGMLMLPPDAEQRAAIEAHVERVVAEEGQEFLGWRTVPTDNSSLGKTALSVEPFMRQCFIKRSSDLENDLDFERKLYVIRRSTAYQIRYGETVMPGGQYFYASSMSYKTIVFKGMLMSEQIPAYYVDLADPDVESALAMVHSRFSTNTFPSWERAHPNRYIIHNGEINTLRGNVNWIHAQQMHFESPLFGDDIKKLIPIVAPDGSDSGMFDNVMEFLTLAGRPVHHVMMMMIPEPWSKHESMSDEKRAFYEYHATLMEPWDGPASMGFTDGIRIGATLDRNGLRPSRYYVTKDDLVVMASEVGVLDIPPENVLYKGRLEPGRMFLVDTEAGRIIHDEEIKHQLASEHPYRQWLDNDLVKLADLPAPALNGKTNGKFSPKWLQPGNRLAKDIDHTYVLQRQQAFGYTFEDLRMLIGPMAKNAIEPVGAMGNDAPLAVLSDRSRLLYDYFKQLFAQVTNPPIDSIREELITATEVMLGTEGNLLQPGPENAIQIKLKYPILTNGELAKLRYINHKSFKSVTLPILFEVDQGEAGLEQALEALYAAADKAIADGYNILILSDRGIDRDQAGIPALLAVSGLHHHLIRNGNRTNAALILESGEPREVHHFATLIGYGISAINPYLAYETLADMINQNLLTDTTYEEAQAKYVKASVKGVVKTLSKMGISTIQSYCGAQIFEAIGLKRSLVDKYFTWTPTRLEGIGLDVIAEEVRRRHHHAFPERQTNGHTLDVGGEWQWRKDGEHHLFNPQTIHALQKATRTGDYKTYRQYAHLINDQTRKLGTLRGLLKFKGQNPIPIEEVESVEAICRRFKTGAMSYGSISKEAHESLAIAMNRIGGKSNTGEGGEDPARFIPDANGDSRKSAIKQVASGRFGVTSEYLVSAQEIQIKMAQGAKPGEGGQLPGAKVYPWIAKVRGSTPGVGLISPPPHHDIYSIEDLAELIHDLKNANRYARINVKLVSEVGVGTIAAGVAKGKADVILISGYDGGTGASPRSSIKHAGLPWELGLAETHQTLVLNRLRSRVVVETDGQLKTGRDVVIAALLGAEEFGFATAPLVTLGCTMMRVCHLDTCPVGVATQNPELRKKFAGDPQYVVNFMQFIAQEMREIMAELGFRTVNEMVGRTDKLEVNEAIEHWKASGLDLSPILHQPAVGPEVGRYCQIQQDHGLDKALDIRVLLELCQPALENGEPVAATLPIKNVNRVVGTILGSELTRRYGGAGLPEDTIRLRFVGSAGQSFGAFMPQGITFDLEGDANDYFGKGLSGGKLIVAPPPGVTFTPEENIIIGNVAFYGATAGESYIRGVAGERFCVRNSGVNVVVEGVGDHGCEYMTGGRVVVLGKTGRNFAAGMSGGFAYVLDWEGDFATRCNQEMVDLDRLELAEEIVEVKAMIERHVQYTNSELGRRVLADWKAMAPKFVKVYPKDYKRMLEIIAQVEAEGLSGDEALMTAFEMNKNDKTRVSGN
ncbi:MAG: glutamate synthase large subunit [Anaerolineaceae bacterium]|nr:glutamate synthase large subunit [Anaerolineaceae bacterium]